MIATLSAPLTLDPQQATTLKIMHATLDFVARTVRLVVEMHDASGQLLERRVVVADSTTVQTWLSNQESTLYNALLNKLGVTGTVA